MRDALSAIFLKRADGNTIADTEVTDNGTTSDEGQIVCVSGSEGEHGNQYDKRVCQRTTVELPLESLTG